MTPAKSANHQFEAARAQKLAEYARWSGDRSLRAGRLVHYLGSEVIGAKDLDKNQIPGEIACLIDEGLHVAWAEASGVAYVCVWEYPAPQPEWSAVFRESDS